MEPVGGPMQLDREVAEQNAIAVSLDGAGAVPAPAAGVEGSSHLGVSAHATLATRYSEEHFS